MVLKEGGSQLYWGSPSGWQHLTEEDEDDNETLSTDKDKETGTNGAVKPNSLKESKVTSTQVKIDSQTDVDPKRQTGDSTVWWYYAKSLSVRGVIMSLALLTGTIVTAEFPSKCDHMKYRIATLTTMKGYGLKSALDLKALILVDS